MNQTDAQIKRGNITPAAPAKAVADYFLKRANENWYGLNQTGIQSLVYIAHGWHLALKEKPLIKESVEAGQYGVHITNLWNAFHKFGDESIPTVGVFYPHFQDYEMDHEATKLFLSQVWEIYQNFTPIQLVPLTNKPGTPWETTRFLHPNKQSVSIPDALIKKYYKDKGKDVGPRFEEPEEPEEPPVVEDVDRVTQFLNRLTGLSQELGVMIALDSKYQAVVVQAKPEDFPFYYGLNKKDRLRQYWDRKVLP